MIRRSFQSYRSALVLLIGYCLVGHLPVVAQDFEFIDVSAERGITPHMPDSSSGSGGASVAVADYDGDGDLDFFLPQKAGTPNRLYRNLGNGFFEEVAAQVGLASDKSTFVSLWVDYDGDADLDLFVVNDSPTASTMFQLFNQDGLGQFTEVTSAAGLQQAPPAGMTSPNWGGVCAGDINNDGYLEIFTVEWGDNGENMPPRGHLFLNNTDGTFTDISVSSGIGAFIETAHQPVMADFNDDGWLDIFVAIDFNANQLWINQQDNTFINMEAVAGLDNNMNDMGVAISDYDNDSDLDIYITNIFVNGQHNVLHRNDSTSGQMMYSEVSMAMGVDDGGWGWGTTFIDGDNDGWLDIAATNGRLSLDSSWLQDPSKYFLNPGGGAAFQDVSDAVQFNDTFVGSALVAADFDRDGRQDLLHACSYDADNPDVIPLRLLQNVLAKGGTQHNYLVVQPRMIGPNHFAIGAEVRATYNGMTTARLITAGISYLGQEPAEAFFGLGDATSVDTLTIDWPDGTVSVLEDVAANQVIEVTGGGFPIPAVSHWGLLVTLLLVLTTATVLYGNRAWTNQANGAIGA